jgi:hypothetical protein
MSPGRSDSIQKQQIVGARFVHRLEHQSRRVTIAGHGRRARSAVMAGQPGVGVAVQIAPELVICA